jgi:hypothetical protein
MGSTEFASFYARFDSLGVENKRSALALAESCINIALLALATSSDPADYDASGRSTIVDTDFREEPRTCTIAHITHNGSTVTINTYASVDDSFSTVSASATLPPNIHIISWSEQ